MGAREWFDAIDARNARITEVLTNAAAVELVRRRARNGRVPDVPIMCGSHQSGYFISLILNGNDVEVSYRAVEGAPPLKGQQHVDDLLSPFEIECLTCSARIRRSSAWIVEEAVKSLTLQRAVIRARRT